MNRFPLLCVVVLLLVAFVSPAWAYDVKPSEQSVTIKPGLTLDYVVERLYARFPDLWPRIRSDLIRLNPESIRGGQLMAGQQLQLVRIVGTVDTPLSPAPEPELPPAIGQAMWMQGNVSAVDTNGEHRALKMNGDVYEGDTIITAPDTQVTLEMIDGAEISLKPDTEFELATYQQPSSEGVGAAFMNLLRGGLRTITGALGKNGSQYRMNTPVATIGVRGTEYAATLCEPGACVGADGNVLEEGLYTGVDEGSIAMENETGSVELSEGEFSFVQSAVVAPVAIASTGLLGLEASTPMPSSFSTPSAPSLSSSSSVDADEVADVPEEEVPVEQPPEEPAPVEEPAEQPQQQAAEEPEQPEEEEESSWGWWLTVLLILLGFGA